MALLMVLRLFVLMVVFFPSPLWADFHYRKWHESLRWRDGMKKSDCPRNAPFEVFKSPENSLHGGACKRARTKALETNCIPKDIFDAMELCNLVPRCRQSYDDQLWSWDTCDESPIHSMSTFLFGCEPCADCDFVKNCRADTESPYFTEFPFEMDFTIKYQFLCKTDLGIPLNNIGLATENGFKLFEQTLDATMTLTGKKYLRLTDLNPDFTQNANLDVNCQLAFHETVKAQLSRNSRKSLEQYWSEIQTLSDATALLRSAYNQIHVALEEKEKRGVSAENTLKDILIIFEKISSQLSKDDKNRYSLNLSMERIQAMLSRFNTFEGQPRIEHDLAIANLREELEMTTQTVVSKMGQIYQQSLLMLGYDPELSRQYEAGFDAIYRSFTK